MPVVVRNVTRAAILATRAGLARTWWARMRGLLGTRGLPEGGGLVIEPCSSVHTWGMRYPIDVAFLDRGGVVLRTWPALRPWRVTPPVRGARRVVELPEGVLEASGTVPGDRIAVEPRGEDP